jgi:hypothetical protein
MHEVTSRRVVDTGVGGGLFLKSPETEAELAQVGPMLEGGGAKRKA